MPFDFNQKHTEKLIRFV